MNNQTLYIECFSGVSGDMTVAALIDLGADVDELIIGLKSLHLDGYSIEITRINKNGIEACDFNVILNPSIINAPDGHFIKRNIFDIFQIIDQSTITDRAKEIAKEIFKIVAEAEAEAHQVKIENIYFHESGAIDSIVDIVGTAICLDNIGIKDIIVSELYDGSGFIKCRKGLIPVPVPAVVNIARKHNLQIKTTNIKGELVTPTGAAIMAAIKTSSELPENYSVKKIGCGAGKRDYPTEGVLRMYLLETESDSI